MCVYLLIYKLYIYTDLILNIFTVFYSILGILAR